MRTILLSQMVEVWQLCVGANVAVGSAEPDT